MKKILYIGNNLSNNKSNVSGIQTLGPLLENEGYFIYYASSKTNKALRLFDMISSIIKYSEKIDSVLIDTYSTQNFYYAWIISIISRRYKIPYVPILHGGNLPARLEKHPKMSNMVFKNSKFNVSPSIYLKDAFNQNGYNNVKYIPNTLNIENYKCIEKDFVCPRLLWVRSFSKIYNPQLAIKVLERLKVTYPNAELCMVGPDSDGTFIDVKKLANKLNLNVKFTGKLKKTEWIELSKAYNVFINTTNFDNTPVSVIEAMALGLPVVSTNVGGMPFLIQNNVHGVLVEPDNVDLMVEAVIELFKSEAKRHQIITNARTKVEQFDWQKVKILWADVI
ncbi:glycosyltransferase family 4 protein [Psychroserpens damuponensis]|uniref:glycosyltransferase family 4 protein n=1 Tax=Psychroserpens damuponensis TaxID=943936 RepID=UPI00058AE38F|nr:glycosyltransferase family 4 protein [Psychroserpens damuponensis]